MEQLSDNLLISTDEIENKTRVLTDAMEEIQELKDEVCMHYLKNEKIVLRIPIVKSDRES